MDSYVLIHKMENGYVYYLIPISSMKINVDNISGTRVSGTDLSEIGKAVHIMFDRAQESQKERG